MGLDRKVQDLLILVYAAQSKRSFWLGDAPFTQAKIGNVPTSGASRAEAPGREDVARSVGPCCIRVRPCAEPTRTASEVARLTQDLREQQSELREPSQKLVAQLKACLDRIGLATDESNRWRRRNSWRRTCRDQVRAR